MNSFEVYSQEYQNNGAVIHLEGFFSSEAGEKLAAIAQVLLSKKFVNLIFDFSKCKIITSPGMAHILQLLLEIVDDYKGRVIFTGLDRQKTVLLDMVGILPMVETASTTETGLLKLGEPVG